MSLSTALSLLNSSFAVNAAQTAVVSRNIANVNTPGYAREIAHVRTNAFGGAEMGVTTRQTNGALLEQMLESTSQSAGSAALSDGLAQLAQTVAVGGATDGAGRNGVSPAALIGNLQSALQLYGSSPADAAGGQGVITAARDLADSLNSASATIRQVRSRADATMAASVATINTLLGQFHKADMAIVVGLQSGADVSLQQDARDTVLAQLAQEIGVSTISNPNGSISIYTDSGLTLYKGAPMDVSFTATPALYAGMSGAAVSVNGVPITGAAAPMAIRSGALAGYAALRDQIGPQYQAQLDQIAHGLISAFAERDQSATPALPDLPGLFTYRGAAGLPAVAMPGLADSIVVNASVDPARGGDITLLRDGGIAAPGGDYTYNRTGAAGFTGRILQLANQLIAPQAFDPAAGLGSAKSLTDFASASVSWLQDQRQQATEKASYHQAVASQASAALTNATGVNLDAEMTNMLNLENTYATTAKLLAAVNSMFATLIDSI